MKKIIKILLLMLVLQGLSINTVFSNSTDFKLEIRRQPQCNDGRDNDLDGKIDYPDDPDCTSWFDDSEKPKIDNNVGGGSSGGTPILLVNVIEFIGTAFPNANIKILKDSQVVSNFKADSEGKFSKNISGLYFGKYNFGIIAEDEKLRKTSLFSFELNIDRGGYMVISDFFLSPTSSIENLDIISGNKINLSGKSIKNTNIKLFIEDVDGTAKLEFNTKTNDLGEYSYSIDTNNYKVSKYKIYLKAINHKNEDSIESSIRYINLLKNTNTNNNNTEIKYKIPCDLNDDKNVDIVDFSILLYWWDKGYKKDLDFNQDGKIDIIDFSIMSFNWTG